MGDIQRADHAKAHTSAQIASTKRIQTASDDPLGTHRALRLRAELAEVEANRGGAAAAQSWMATADSALGSVSDVIHRSRELILQAASGSTTNEDRAQIALELTGLLGQVKQAANSQVGDLYVFSGQTSGTAPYAAGASDTYLGDGNAVVRTIGPGQSVQVNVTGDAVFGGFPGDGKLLDTMRTAITALNGSTPADLATLRGATLQSLTANLNTVITARSEIGATQNRVTLADSRLEEMSLAVTTRLSGVEDVDLAAAITTLTSQETAYQAALSATAKVVQPSLMDFLR